jgi:glycosyltransferase involved in cell wall biosynthesis
VADASPPLTSSLDVLVPVLNRPANIGPLVESLFGSEQQIEFELYVIGNADDRDELRAVQDAINDQPRAHLFAVPWPGGIRGDYARKINYGLWMSGSPWLLCGADDLVFHPGWAEAAIAAGEESGACFVATNDLANPKVVKGLHATHPVVRRDYAVECGTIDCPGIVYHEGYFHQYVDSEATDTAMFRGCFAAAAESKVEHRHPIWGTADDDETYRHGQSTGRADLALYAQRRRLWT